jgi:hypothetical protein
MESINDPMLYEGLIPSKAYFNDITEEEYQELKRKSKGK